RDAGAAAPDQGPAHRPAVSSQGGGRPARPGSAAVRDPAPAPRRRRGLLLPAVLAALGFAVLISLGTWQLERKAWKEALIDTLSGRLAEPPAALPPPERWPSLDADDDEFRRVAFRGQFLNDQEALVYTTGSALRTDASGPGYWVFTPARLGDGRLVVVDRGF